MIKHAFFIFLTVFMEGTLLNDLDINGILPNFSLIYLLYVGFYLELYTALIIAAILGSLVDMSGTFPLGTTVLVYALLVFVINYLSTFLDFRNLGSWLLGILIGTSALYFSYYGVSQMIFENAMPLQQLITNFIILLGYNLFITLLFYPGFKLYENRTQTRKTSESLMEI